MSAFGEDHFDRWMFDRRRKYAVSAETLISFEDYKHMGTVSHYTEVGKQRWIPAFAYDDEKLRAVLMQVGTAFLKRPRSAWRPITNWRTLDRKCTAKALRLTSAGMPEYEKATVDKFQDAIKKSGSYLSLYAGVALHFWRRGLDSVAVAELLSMTPAQVRKRAGNMVAVARELGFETFAAHKSRGRRFEGAALEHKNRARLKSLGIRPEFCEGICFDCRVEPVDTSRCKWRCSTCQDAYNRRSKANRAAHRAA